MGSKSKKQLMEFYQTPERNGVLQDNSQRVPPSPKRLAWSKKGNALDIASKSISRFPMQSPPKSSDGIFLILISNLMETLSNHSRLIENLKRFTGSPRAFRVPMLNTRYTEGIQYLAQEAQCYWLITDTSLIAKRLMKKSYFVCIDFQRLSEAEQARLGHEAEISYSDGNGKVFQTQPYEYTDFPLDSIRLYFIDNLLLLPSEY